MSASQALRRPRPIAFSILLCTVGCTVGPDYHPPDVALPKSFRQSPEATSTQPTPEAWWTLFGDPLLTELERDALDSAPDLAAAEARVREARALSGLVRAGTLPSADGTAGYARSRGSANVPTGVRPGGLGPGIDSNLWQAGFDASWEIDAFGGVRRAAESAEAGFEAAEDDREAAKLTLLAEVARTEIELRGAQRRLAIAKGNLELERDSLLLIRSTFAAGLVSHFDVLRAEAQVSDVKAAIPPLEADSYAAMFRLGVLVGRPPEELVDRLAIAQPIPQSVQALPPGLPSDLLRRRPDIRAAERRLASANARIGAAEADYYPHFALTSIAGLESLHASSFPDIASGYYSASPGITWSIFDAGRVHFKVLAAEARTDAAAADYRRVVLEALKEVETALVFYGRDEARESALSSAVGDERAAVSLANRLYSQGLVSFTAVLDAERSLYSAEDGFVQSEEEGALAQVALIKALGGGWNR